MSRGKTNAGIEIFRHQYSQYSNSNLGANQPKKNWSSGETDHPITPEHHRDNTPTNNEALWNEQDGLGCVSI
eukprot:2840013-Ditylum_brightwellii.AAC.1